MVHRALYVTPETFETNVRWMLQHGQIITTDELNEATHQTRFVITFDDGWKDCFLYALPILKRYHCIAEFFLTTGNIDNRELFWSENLGLIVIDAIKQNNVEFVVRRLSFLVSELNHDYDLEGRIDFDRSSEDIRYLIDRLIESMKYLSNAEREKIILTLCKELKVNFNNDGDNLLLSWKEISLMANEGFRFGSHTHTHVLLDRVDDKTIDSELRQSKSILEKRLGREIDTFSYPNGYYQNPYIQRSLEKHGYRRAYILDSKPFCKNYELLIPRFLVFEDVCRYMSKYFINSILANKLKLKVARDIYRSITTKMIK